MRKLIFSACIVSMALNLSAREQLYMNIAGIQPLVEHSKDAFSSDFAQLVSKVQDDCVNANVLRKAFPELAECILLEIARNKASEDAFYALCNLFAIKSASKTVFRNRDSNELAQGIVHCIDELFLLLPEEIGSMVTRAPSFEFTSRGLREIIIEKVVPYVKDLLECACSVESLSDNVIVTLTTLELQGESICSKIDHLDQAFTQDNVALETAKDTLCTIDSQVDVINDGLWTIESKLDCAHEVNSKMDIIDDTIGSTDATFDAVTANAQAVESIVCAIESKIDAIIAENSTESIDSTIDVIDDDVFSIESKVCLIESGLEVLNSRIDVIKTCVVEIGDGVSIIDSLICV